MNLETIRTYCLSKADVEESMPFGPDVLVYKVNGKVFLITSFNEPVRFTVKCDPEEAISLRETFDAIKPGYHMNKKHWNTIHAEENISDKVLKKCIDASYGLVKPKPKKIRKKP